jgi:hypothetical protein
MEQTITLSGLAVLLIGFGTQFLKKKYPKIDPRVFSFAISAVCGLIYALSKTFIPEEILARLLTFGILAWGATTSLYQIQK